MFKYILLFVSSLTIAQNTTNTLKFTTKQLNIQSRILQDEEELRSGIKRLDFGVPIKTPIKLLDLKYKEGENYVLNIDCEGAKSLNFIFSKFDIPDGAYLDLFINGDLKHHFTNKDQEIGGKLSTYPIYGQTAQFVYHEVANQPKGKIQLSHTIYGYKDFKILEEKSINDITCINNINCPQYSNYQDIKRSVVVLLTNTNSSFCSGAIVNNTSNDLTPYVLTANHCGPSSSTKFRLNYEAATCLEQNTTINNVVSGCTIRANNANSDFFLVEMASPIPPAYAPFYAGWNRSVTPATQAVGIHHPAGAVKKISLDNDPLSIASYSGSNNAHWRVATWEDGVTLGGSSGSPLFNQNKQIVGQLHGGASSCDNQSGITNNTNDYYGRFDISWNTGSTIDTRLKEWLDPSNTGVESINGINNTSQLPNRNGALLNQNNQNTCDVMYIPSFEFRNSGINTLTQTTINYSINGGALQTYNWTGNLSTYQTTRIELPQQNLTSGINSFMIKITTINGQTDSVITDNTINFNVTKIDGLSLKLELNLDEYPEETGWRITNPSANNATIFSKLAGSYTNASSQSIENLCLEPGCYRLVMTDSEGDGMCCNYGNGSFKLTNELTGEILASGGEFLTTKTVPFCVGSVSVNELQKQLISIYPNPSSNGNIAIKTTQELNNIHLYNLLGQEVPLTVTKTDQGFELDTEKNIKGVWILKYQYQNQFISEKIIFE